MNIQAFYPHEKDNHMYEISNCELNGDKYNQIYTFMCICQAMMIVLIKTYRNFNSDDSKLNKLVSINDLINSISNDSDEFLSLFCGDDASNNEFTNRKTVELFIKTMRDIYAR